MYKILLLFIALSLSSAAFAQQPTDRLGEMPPMRPNPPVPVEVFAGNNYLNFQMIVSKPFQQGSRFGFFNVTNFNGNYDNNLRRNEFLTQGLVNFEVYKGISLAAGATMNYVTGFRPTAGLQYLYGNREWLIVLLPRMDLRDDYNFETFGLVEYKPQLTKKLGLYTRVQGLYNHNIKQEFHDRSYLYFRAGFSYQNYQFGLGANFDRYGPMKVSGDNFGLFLRVLLNN
jgi:hypothetical protein